MEIFWTAILGAIQGFTEFLPVSSSGHLALAQLMLASNRTGAFLSSQPLLFEILLHLATLIAVLVFYRRDVVRAVKGLGRAMAALPTGRFKSAISTDDDAGLAIALAAGTAVTGAIGLLMRGPAAAVSRSPLGLGCAFLAYACLLFASRRWTGGSRRLSLKIALVIGIIQGIAVLPGISRSGATIATGLALGLEREAAARFSFLLSIPAIIGAAVLEIDFTALVSGGRIDAYPYLFGALAAFLVGLASLHLLVRLVCRGRIWLFAPYVALVGLSSFFLI